MTEEFPEITAWRHLGGNVWELATVIGAYEELRFEPMFNDPGDWDIQLIHDDVADVFMEKGVLALIEFRGQTSTWRCVAQPSRTEDGERILDVGGEGALALLGDETAWRDPTQSLNTQPEAQPKLYTGSAEQVILALVKENYVDRAQRPLHVPVSSGIGIASRARSNFSNLLELVLKKAEAGEVAVNIGLVRTTATSARLELQVWAPEDRSADIHLSELIGTLGPWTTTIEPPTLTEAIVSGVEGTWKQVITPESQADADDWGGHRSGLVSGPQSYDIPDLQQAGEEALKEGRSKVNIAVEATDSEGLMAFRDFNVGETVTVTLDAGLVIVDVISGMAVTISDSIPEVVPKVGNPDADDPLITLGQLIRSQNRRLRAQEQRQIPVPVVTP